MMFCTLQNGFLKKTYISLRFTKNIVPFFREPELRGINVICVYLATKEIKNQQRYFQIKNFNFEAVQSFTYLGSLINDNSAEIKERALMANKGFYGLKRQFRSQFLSIKK